MTKPPNRKLTESDWAVIQAAREFCVSESMPTRGGEELEHAVETWEWDERAREQAEADERQRERTGDPRS